MNNTDILLEDLEDVLDDATSMPMTKKSLVDVDKIKTIIEDIRLNTPQENKSREMLTAVNNYADDTLLEIDDSLYKALSDVRRIRQNIMNSQHRNTSANDNP